MSYSTGRGRASTRCKTLVALAACLQCLGAQAASAPDWMRAQVSASLPAHDDKADAVQMYSETVLTVTPSGSLKHLYRAAFKILRPSGERRGIVRVAFDRQSKITSLRAWSIPASGKDYELKEKDAVESAVFGVSNGELMTDNRMMLMRIPAAVPGSLVGYQVEQEYRPYMRTDEWDFQDTVPVRAATYKLQMPAGWTYRAAWINHPALQPTVVNGGVQWTVADIKPVREENSMPAWQGIAGKLYLSLIPPDGQSSGMQSWSDIGAWYAGLTRDRRDASAELKQQAAQLTASSPSLFAKIEALAKFAQNDIRYVAIEIGIGGYQPRSASYVLKNRYGDCKDKVTLMSAMLKELGVESHYVLINTKRGSVVGVTPPNLGFNHAILAVQLPSTADNPKVQSFVMHPKLGKLVFFDPTDELTPFGLVRGELQSNYGLLVANETGELLQLPRLPSAANAIERTAHMTLDETGTLQGEINEIWSGDPAAWQRNYLRSISQDSDRIKTVEKTLAQSLNAFEIDFAAMSNLTKSDAPFRWRYTITAQGYAKAVGDLLLVRPRLVGSKSSNLLETKEAREHPIEFPRPERHQDVFEIALPPGYELEDLPPPVNLDHGFIAYQSNSELVGGKLRYTRVFEVKELTVPVDKAEELKLFYRAIENDERNVAVLKRSR